MPLVLQDVVKYWTDRGLAACCSDFPVGVVRETPPSSLRMTLVRTTNLTIQAVRVFDLLVASHKKSEDHQHQDSSSGDQECLYQIYLQSMQYLSTYHILDKRDGLTNQLTDSDCHL